MTLAFRQLPIPDSPVSRWDPRWKLAALLLASAGTASLRSPLLAAVSLAAAVVLAAFARLPRRAILNRLGLLALAVLPVLIAVPFTLDQAGPGWDIGPVRASERGITAALGVTLRALAIGVFALVLARTAAPPRTFAAARHLRVPGVLVQVAQLAHRYAFLLADEARRVRVALRTRGFRARTNAHTYRTLGHAVGGLLVRGGDRADRVAAAMRCRGFDGTYRTTTPFRTTPADVLSFLLAAAGTIALVVVDRTISVRNAESGMRNASQTDALGSEFCTPHSAIRTSQLSHTYADGRTALAGVTIRVSEGERVALVGPNGAGKTTLFLRLCGVLPGRPGEAAVAGLDPADPAHRRKLPGIVGVVFQNPDDQLVSATVGEDVAFGPLNLGATPAEAVERAGEALRQVGLGGYEERVPHALSGGEKRRAALAGVLVMRPAVLLLDEPTMYLDPRGRRELIRLLAGLPGTMLIATHDLELVLDLCPRAIVLDGGRVMADGSSTELLADAALMDRHGLEVPARLGVR